MQQLEQQLKDFVRGGLKLFWQRQAIFAGATLLTAYYMDLRIAVISYLFCQVSEIFDLYISKKVTNWQDGNPETARHFHKMLMFSSVLSAFTIVQYVVLVSYREGPALHFAPLFFLFCAALFAAMNNHQLPKVLAVRLVIYGTVFLLIPAYDLWVVRPGLGSELWLQFATTLFVLYFILDSARVMLGVYRTSLNQINELCTERDRVSAAYEVQSQFVAVVSHELRTPLTSIKGALGLMNSGALGALPTEMAGIAKIAQKNSDRLALLIDDLLDLQKLEAGKMTFNFDSVNLADLLEESASANKSYAEPMGVSVELMALDNRLTVKADRDRLMQVLANVLSNAIKFSKRDSRVELSLEKSGGKARILVRDYGVGIPENSRDLVFGRFTQVDSTDQREIGGTGLGMSITKQILAGHDATIDFTSTLGEGTTFVVELDLLDIDDTEPASIAA
jgi:signal transduction histidine kinase